MATESFQQCSIIIPVLDDTESLENLLEQLQPARQLGHEVIVVDGGSDDALETVCNDRVDFFLSAQAGRAAQMNTGAAAAGGEVFWFLHADSKLSIEPCISQIMALHESEKVWGRFDIHLSGNDRRFRIIETMMNWRSAMTGIATGDQGIFINRKTFEHIEGFAQIPLMEDIEISKRLKKFCSPLLCSQKIMTSSRRWEKNGIFRTMLLMWYLRLAYAMGTSPERLSKHYRPCS
ncbi:MAG: glycosyltransferase family 2 protein [Gammaproteobacteria bacterium]|nr:TIGR04283 family arsenosugar biosynthesis glycosyltransferase [Gammaproteobacteria bacterium]NNJ91079.1 glycosyltransferase family 2 protein [Gammaproteobacteria bacterium]